MAVHRITIPLVGIIFLVCLGTPVPALAQTTLSLSTAARLAAARAPDVNTGTLLAFAWHESQLRPFAVHDNTTRQGFLPTSAADAVALAHQELGSQFSELAVVLGPRVGLAERGENVSLGQANEWSTPAPYAASRPGRTLCSRSRRPARP